MPTPFGMTTTPAEIAPTATTTTGLRIAATASSAPLTATTIAGLKPIATTAVSARCDIAIEVRRKLPDCRIYLVCEDGHPEKLAALEKAAELGLIDGYCLGALTDRQARAWLRETAEAMPGGSAR